MKVMSASLIHIRPAAVPPATVLVSVSRTKCAEVSQDFIAMIHPKFAMMILEMSAIPSEVEQIVVDCVFRRIEACTKMCSSRASRRCIVSLVDMACEPLD